MSEARIDRLEVQLARIERPIIRIEERLAVTLPHLATKAELADKPARHYKLECQGCNDRRVTVALAAGAMLLTYLPHR